MYKRDDSPEAKAFYEAENRKLKFIMEMNDRMWKNQPRVVYDRKNDTVNVVCGKEKMWKD